MLFLVINDIDIQLAETRKLIQRNHIAVIALSTTKRVELINKRKFAAASLDKKVETFVVYIAALLATLFHPRKEAYIRTLIIKETFIKITTKYSEYANVLSADLAMELQKYTRIINYAIDLLEKKQLSYGPI